MKLYREATGYVLEREGALRRSRHFDLDVLFTGWAKGDWSAAFEEEVDRVRPLAPIERQEVWAAGVTYYRSREARMEESEREADVYDRVYDAERPELFFKATPHRVSGPGESVAIRSDSSWNVPEAELALAVDSRGRIFGYTIGNDMSSRSIEGDNPLYLPQAKIYDGSCSLGPCLYLTPTPLPASTEIHLSIERAGSAVFEGTTRLSEMKRRPEELVDYLYRQSSFPHGCYLLTGTGIVPDASFTLEAGDVVTITIEPIGTLTNAVGQGARTPHSPRTSS